MSPASRLPLGPEPKRALVTGAAGYFGGVLARWLADRGVAVVSLDRLDDPEPDPRIVYARADLRFADQTRAVFDRHAPFDAVFHCAAFMGHEKPDPDDLWESNVTGTEHVAESCIAHGIRKVVYTSTICVFGREYAHFVTEDEPTCRAGRNDRHLGDGAGANRANYAPLTPLSFLTRAARVYPDKTAVVHGRLRYSYRGFDRRCRRLASALLKAGVGRGDTVAVLANNSPAMLEAHFGVPMMGGVLNALNYRLDAPTIAVCLEHGGAKVLVADCEYAETTRAALARVKNPPKLVEIDDTEANYGPAGSTRLGSLDYEQFIAGGDPAYRSDEPQDEWQAMALGYTSGTTGNPKGVVYHHRGAYLNSLSDVLTMKLRLIVKIGEFTYKV